MSGPPPGRGNSHSVGSERPKMTARKPAHAAADADEVEPKRRKKGEHGEEPELSAAALKAHTRQHSKAKEDDDESRGGKTVTTLKASRTVLGSSKTSKKKKKKAKESSETESEAPARKKSKKRRGDELAKIESVSSGSEAPGDDDEECRYCDKPLLASQPRFKDEVAHFRCGKTFRAAGYSVKKKNEKLHKELLRMKKGSPKEFKEVLHDIIAQ